jgi:hypothetical protein
MFSGCPVRKSAGGIQSSEQRPKALDAQNDDLPQITLWSSFNTLMTPHSVTVKSY